MTRSRNQSGQRADFGADRATPRRVLQTGEPVRRRPAAERVGPLDLPQQRRRLRRQVAGFVHARQRRPHPRPTAAHGVGIVAAPAQHQQPGRQRRERSYGRHVRLIAETELAHRIVGQRVGAALDDERLRLESGHRRHDALLHQPGEFVIVQAARNGIVVELAIPIGLPAAERPALAFVDRGDKHSRIVGQRVLDTVAMMGVDVHIGDPCQSPIEKGEDAEDRVVEVAEAAGTVRPAVMGAARRAVDHAAVRQQFRCVYCCAAGRRRPSEDLAEDRIAVGAQVVARPVSVRGRLGLLAMDHGIHIGGIVEPAELRPRRHRTVDVNIIRQPAERPAQVDDQRHPGYRQRVFAAIARTPVDFAADEAGAVHDTQVAPAPARGNASALPVFHRTVIVAASLGGAAYAG